MSDVCNSHKHVRTLEACFVRLEPSSMFDNFACYSSKLESF